MYKLAPLDKLIRGAGVITIAYTNIVTNNVTRKINY